jgi:hypothetical protein
MLVAGYRVDVVANGTIASLWNSSASGASGAVTPLRQFRYDGLQLS